MNLSSRGIVPQRSCYEHKGCEVLAPLTQQTPGGVRHWRKRPPLPPAVSAVPRRFVHRQEPSPSTPPCPLSLPPPLLCAQRRPPGMPHTANWCKTSMPINKHIFILYHTLRRTVEMMLVQSGVIWLNKHSSSRLRRLGDRLGHRII